MSDLDDAREELRQLFQKRRQAGFIGARRQMTPAILKERIARLSARLRALKYSHDVARQSFDVSDVKKNDE